MFVATTPRLLALVNINLSKSEIFSALIFCKKNFAPNYDLEHVLEQVSRETSFEKVGKKLMNFGYFCRTLQLHLFPRGPKLVLDS